MGITGRLQWGLGSRKILVKSVNVDMCSTWVFVFKYNYHNRSLHVIKFIFVADFYFLFIIYFYLSMLYY